MKCLAVYNSLGACRQSVWSHQHGFNGHSVVGSSCALVFCFRGTVCGVSGNPSEWLVTLGFCFSELILATSVVQSCSLCATQMLLLVCCRKEGTRGKVGGNSLHLLKLYCH